MALSQGLVTLPGPYAELPSRFWCGRGRRGYSERHVPPDPLSGRKMMREKLWREFFSDPSQWWDHRSEKVNPRYPDFTHKTTEQSLWLVGNLNPAWVESELAAMAPGLLQSDIFSWHVRLRRHVKAGDYKKTLDIFQQMQRDGMILDTFTFVPVLNACSNLGSLEEGKRVHEQIIQRGCESDVYVANCLVNMYAKCGSFEDAWCVFNKMQKHDLISWNAMIGGYVKSGKGVKVMELFKKMQEEGVEPDFITFAGVLNACASLAALEEGRRVHKQIIGRGCESDVYVATSLVNMYAKCGSIDDAWNAFNKIQKHDLVSWNAMIGGYVTSGHELKAMELFRQMQQEGVRPDAVTFVGVLNACASVKALEEGRRIHIEIIRRGCESDNYVATSLIDMYAKCGSIEDAWSVFNKMQERGVISWNAMIGGYVNSEQGMKAIELFRKMQEGGMESNTVTFVVVFNACASIAALEEGRRVHEQAIQRGWESDVFVATCIVDMYAKCGSMVDAWEVFNKMQERSVVSWNAIIGGYVKSEQGLKALELFKKMQQEGMEPNAITFAGVLNACSSVAAFEEGMRVHEQIILKGYKSDVYLTNCLLVMYSKCGSIMDAWTVFNKMGERDIVSWNTMIGGYAEHGNPKKAIGLFKQMGKEEVEINEITFTCLLSACSHGGLVKEGLRYFNFMISGYNVLPVAEHYACIVDLLGRAGKLKEAEEIAIRMPMEVDATAWMSLLGACRIYGNIQMAERVAKRCWVLDPENASGHVLLSNILAAAGKRYRNAPI